MHLETKSRIRASAWFIGERLNVRGVGNDDTLSMVPPTLRAGKMGLAILFRFGVVVFIELDTAEQAAFIESINPLILEKFESFEKDEVEIEILPNETERLDPRGILILNEPSTQRIQVVARVLAKSIVLSYYETQVARVFDDIEPLAEKLRQSGRIPESSNKLMRQIGAVLVAETRTTGRVEIAEKPEITWDFPELDKLYERLSAEYELRERDLALERKLGLISRIAETLLDLLQHRRSLHVEWYIAILIVLELLMTLYSMFKGM